MASAADAHAFMQLSVKFEKLKKKVRKARARSVSATTLTLTNPRIRTRIVGQVTKVYMTG